VTMFENYVRAVRSLIDSLNVPLEDAIEMARVPADVRASVRTQFEEETALPIRSASVISARRGPLPWFSGWDSSAGYYWRRQRSYLIDRSGWSLGAVGSLDDATDRILSHLEDPSLHGPTQFDVRGLVMGHVQSGKTANFCALVAKAADAGYKLIIILSGVHNSLRLQTQRRINRLLGLDPTGVPEPEPGRRWIGLTTPMLDGDFRPGTLDANVLQGNEHVLLVCKKNVSVLRRLTHWIANKAPASLPVLVIDDEADQASVNTGGNRSPMHEEVDLTADDLGDADTDDELNPSVINGQIRLLLRSFNRVSFVAYTATPFANVLINHLAIDREVFHDLYPRDFIVALPMPHGYTGAERLFGRDALPGEDTNQASLDVVEIVPDYEVELLSPRAEDIDVYEPVVTPSLGMAILDFVLSTAARMQRSKRDIPATMLVHTHHRTPVQKRLGVILREHLSDCRQSWRYDRESIRPKLMARWNSRFRPVTAAVNANLDIPFEAIEDALERLFRGLIKVLVYCCRR